MSEKILKQSVSGEHLTAIANFIVHWDKVAIYLNISEAEVVDIKEDNPNNNFMRKVALLRKWSSKFGDRATYQCLIELAKENGDAKLSSQIIDLLGKP